ncbi:hypothetical protein L9F63_015958, partial [Diploptera punctata]
FHGFYSTVAKNITLIASTSVKSIHSTLSGQHRTEYSSLVSSQRTEHSLLIWTKVKTLVIRILVTSTIAKIRTLVLVRLHKWSQRTQHSSNRTLVVRWHIILQSSLSTHQYKVIIAVFSKSTEHSTVAYNITLVYSALVSISTVALDETLVDIGIVAKYRTLVSISSNNHLLNGSDSSLPISLVRSHTTAHSSLHRTEHPSMYVRLHTTLHSSLYVRNLVASSQITEHPSLYCRKVQSSRRYKITEHSLLEKNRTLFDST